MAFAVLMNLNINNCLTVHYVRLPNPCLTHVLLHIHAYNHRYPAVARATTSQACGQNKPTL